MKTSVIQPATLSTCESLVEPPARQTRPSVGSHPTPTWTGAISTQTHVRTERSKRLPLGELVYVSSWEDNFVDAHGHDPRSEYVERYWLPILGPASTWFLRRSAWYLEGAPSGFRFNANHWARWLGVGNSTSKNSPIARILNRCIDFGMVRPGRVERGTLTSVSVRRKMPWLTTNQVRRLPEDLADMYTGEFEPPTSNPTLEVMRDRSRAMAQELLGTLGNGQDATRELMRAGFHPSIAGDSVKWAQENLPSGVNCR